MTMFEQLAFFAVTIALIVLVMYPFQRRAATRRRGLIHSIVEQYGDSVSVSTGVFLEFDSVSFERDGTRFEGRYSNTRSGMRYVMAFDVPLLREKFHLESRFFWNKLGNGLPADCQPVSVRGLEHMHLVSRNPAFLSALLANEDLVGELIAYGDRRCGVITITLADGRVWISWAINPRRDTEEVHEQICGTAVVLHDGLRALTRTAVSTAEGGQRRSQCEF